MRFRFFDLRVVCLLLLIGLTGIGIGGVGGGAGEAWADEIVPMAPCRVMDTRNTGVGYVSAGTQVDFAVRNAPSPPGASQGGQSGCGIPYNATGIVINLAAVQPSNNGHVHLWAFGSPQPTASALNVTLLQTENTGTFALLSANGPSMDLSIKNVGFSTYWVIDILGYAVPSTAALVGQATDLTLDSILTVETVDGATVKAYASDNTPSFKSSWLSAAPDAVGTCVHINGIYTQHPLTGLSIFEARSLPIVVIGYCGPN